MRGGAPDPDVVEPPDQHPQPAGSDVGELVRGAPPLAVGEAVENVVDPLERPTVGEGANGGDRDLLGVEVGQELVLVQRPGR